MSTPRFASLHAADQETALYVVDPELRIVSFNKALQRIFPGLKAGDTCHEAFCGSRFQCPGCPLKNTGDRHSLFFNEKLGQWLDVHWADVDWPGREGCRVFMADPVHEGNKNLLNDLAHLASYEELYRIDPRADTFRCLYRDSGCTSLRPGAGTLSKQLLEEAGSTVLADSLPAFREFWDRPSLFTRLENAPSLSVSTDVRERRSDGSVRLVRRTLSLHTEPEGGQESIFCFLSTLDGPAGRNGDETSDSLLRLPRGNDFLAAAAQKLETGRGPWCIAAIDIEHFKLFNEWRGRENGDRLLRDVAGALLALPDSVSTLAGYMGNDNFAVLLEDKPDAADRMRAALVDGVPEFRTSDSFLPVVGVCPVRDGLALSRIYDRAVLALSTLRDRCDKKTSRFEPSMLEAIEGEQELLAEVKDALARDEITFHVQPQCRIATGRIVGGEVLIRWRRSDGTFVPPSKFIPVMERNGFVTTLDLHVWEMAFRWLHDLTGRRIRPVPISVNVSRTDVYNLDVVECLRGLAVKYDIDPSLIKVEITESAYRKEEEQEQGSRLGTTAAELRNSGFMVLMDDFGSGYSSLGMIDRLNVDVLKIDMIFLKILKSDPRKGMWLINSVIDMANATDLPIIMEGVETKEQALLIDSLGGLYAQGYYFHRPMPAADFEALLADETKIDRNGLRKETAEPLRNSELFSGRAIPDFILNDLMGAVAIVEVVRGTPVLRRCNRQWARLTSISAGSGTRSCLEILQRIHEDDRAALLSSMQGQTGDSPESKEYDLRYLALDEHYHHILVRCYQLGTRHGRRSWCISCRDNTAQHRHEHRLQATNAALLSLINRSEGPLGHYRTPEEKKTGDALLREVTIGGTLSVRCDKDLSLYSASPTFLSMLGYESTEELERCTGGRILNLLHPDERRRILSRMGPEFPPDYEYVTTGRVLKKDGTYMWALNKGRLIHDRTAGPILVTASVDLTDALEKQTELLDRNTMLLSMSGEMRFLGAGMPGGYHRCNDGAGFEFLHISDAFLRMTGYDRPQIKELFDNKLINMVHPTDRKSVENALLSSHEVIPVLEFRLCAASGWISVMDQLVRTRYEGRDYLQGIALEVTETVRLRSRMEMLMQHSPNCILLATVTDGRIHRETLINGLFRDGCTNGRKRPYQGLLPEEEERLERELLSAAGKHLDVQMQLQAAFRPGRPAWILLTASFMGEELGSVKYLVLMSDVSTEVRREKEIASEREKFDATLRLAGISSWDWNMEDRTLTLSYRSGGKGRRMSRTVMTSFPDRLLKHCYVPKYFHAAFLGELDKIRANDGTMPNRFELPLQMPDGKLSWIQIDYETIRNADGEPVRAVGAYTDITQRKKEEARAEEERAMLSLLRSSALYDFRANLNADTIEVGKGAEEWTRHTGNTPRSLGMTLHFIAQNIVMPEFRNSFQEFSDRNRLIQCFRCNARMQSMEYACMVDGAPSWRRMNVYLSEMKGRDEVFAYIFVVNIDKQKKKERMLTDMAERDALTGLFNRHRALPEIEAWLAENIGTPSVLVMFDIDNLKQINDGRGHPAGDEAIRKTALHLKSSFRDNDILCRMGGDEFLVFCKGISEEDLARRLHGIVDNPPAADSGAPITMTAGYSRYPEDGRIFAELYSRADIALFRAKRYGKKTFFGYDQSMAPETDD